MIERGGSRNLAPVSLGLLLLAASLVSCQTARADIPPAERDALIDLYHSTNGAEWTRDTGWLGDPGTECSWYGIECTGDHVTSINLNFNNLIGTIPPELSNLTELRYLYMDRNDLRGPIPSELGSLNDLVYLTLGSNRLSGSIPIELGSLANLEILNLPYNELTGMIPTQLGQMGNLTNLILYGNQLTGTIPAVLGDLTGLQALQLSANQLTGTVPARLGDLTSLLYLGLGSNRLEGSMPIELTGLTNLLDGASDFRWNSLYTDSAILDAFLTLKQQDGGDWSGTQTIAPEDLTITATGDHWVQLGWSAIPYTGDEGGYEVCYTETAGGPYTLFETTEDKTVTSSLVTGLEMATEYLFVVRTVTLAHGDNQNDLRSPYTAEIPGTTIPGTPTPIPTGTPTPGAGTIGVALVMDDRALEAGEPFHLGVTTWNETGATETVQLFIILDVARQYWCWPGWTQEIDSEERSLPHGFRRIDEPILDLTWPPGAGSMENLRFWGAFTDPAVVDLVGEYDVVTWRFE